MIYEKHYETAMNYRPGDLKSNLLAELRSYLNLGPVNDDELFRECKGATDAILQSWRSRKIDPKNKEAVTQFYVETPLYCYELIGFEIDTPLHRQKQLEDFAKLLHSHRKLRGCDYGSGVGTLGIYLNRRGIQCDFADVSAINLGFIEQRLKTRQIQGIRRFNLMKEKILANEYDFITAFDVLEHVTDPVALLEDLSHRLKVGGLLIFNLLQEVEDDTPHLLRDLNLIRKNIRGFGMSKLTSIGEFKVYQKVARNRLANFTIHQADRFFWEFREQVRTWAKKNGPRSQPGSSGHSH